MIRQLKVELQKRIKNLRERERERERFIKKKDRNKESKNI